MAHANEGEIHKTHHVYEKGSYGPAEYAHQEYPKVLYHSKHDPLTVNSADEERAAKKRGYQEGLKHFSETLSSTEA